MITQSLSAFIIIAITTTGFNSLAAAEKTNCTLVTPSEATEFHQAKPPTVTIYPGTGTEEEVQMEFTIPSLIKGTPDQLKRYKIKDKDGSVNIIMLTYLYQNSNLAPADIDKLLLAALEKRRQYWTTQAKSSGVDAILAESSLAVNNFILNRNKTNLSEEDRKQIIKEVLGPITDYDKNMKYEYKDVENGKYVTRPAKHLSDILPPEFYSVATSTSTGGFLKNRKDPGVYTCEYLPALGRLPVAGKVESIHRPGQK